jgi:hypothetical protein
MTQEKIDTNGFDSHGHSDTVHGHEHVHITHHAKGGDASRIEHLTSVHQHEHNHSATDHAHEAHEDAGREHAHEAHIHDHAHPAHS